MPCNVRVGVGIDAAGIGLPPEGPVFEGPLVEELGGIVDSDGGVSFGAFVDGFGDSDVVDDGVSFGGFVDGFGDSGVVGVS